jgi:hypothetical protein
MNIISCACGGMGFLCLYAGFRRYFCISCYILLSFVKNRETRFFQKTWFLGLANLNLLWLTGNEIHKPLSLRGKTFDKKYL